ncbi:hypothetical protein [Jannaschia seohaensis]|uniref:Uncharacterized protein n=1 Tax=Jannaschia seohaensis TaxID=475081 RepID=A0A2Y9A138_9RHOB|nr:hypothetical protein [Jannaschia seohaensis]PWJ21973.1 hypothetical protein BCF38_101382 [Jannaschia seohaensis]SSA38251.1 hypothetical protein SAMN05421539_101382 [Jannaschia seohaensis]
MIRPLLLAISLTAPLPVMAAPNAQLVASVQVRLDQLGFSDVDAALLSTRQIAALHTQLQGDALAFGPDWIRTRQKVKAILRLDPPRRD